MENATDWTLHARNASASSAMEITRRRRIRDCTRPTARHSPQLSSARGPVAGRRCGRKRPCQRLLRRARRSLADRAVRVPPYGSRGTDRAKTRAPPCVESTSERMSRRGAARSDAARRSYARARSDECLPGPTAEVPGTRYRGIDPEMRPPSMPRRKDELVGFVRALPGLQHDVSVLPMTL